MGSVAIDIRTGAVHSATEISYSDYLDGARWECIGCTAPMIAVACDGEETYRTVPHFRKRRDHDDDCTGEDYFSSSGASNVKSGGSSVTPDRLILRARAEVAASESVGARKLSDGHITALPTRLVRAVTAKPSGSAYSLHTIAHAFATVPDQKYCALTLPGMETSTYGKLFWRILSSTPEKQFIPPSSGQVFYSPIRFNRLNVTPGGTQLTLDAGIQRTTKFEKEQGKKSDFQSFTVTLDLRQHSTRVQSSNIKCLEFWREQQARLYNSGSKATVFIFFVGEAASIGHYRVADPRLFTFMQLPRDWKPC